MVIEVKNLDKCIAKFDKAREVDMYPFIQKATQLVQRTAKDMAPVDTGHLKRNIKRKTERIGKSGVIGTVYDVVEYAPYQEFGTSKMKAQPFMYPAMKVHDEDITKGAKKYISRYLRKL